MKNKNAVALGKMGKGVPRKYTPEDIARRTERIRAAQKLRVENLRREKDLCDML